MKKNYEEPKLEINLFDNQINLSNASVTIEYPWGSDNNVFFE